MNLVPVVAVAADRLAGEPPTALHPVVWMGRYCAWAGRRLDAVTAPGPQVLAGGAAALAGIVASAAAAVALRRVLARLPRPLATVTEAAALSTLLSWRMLEREVLAVERALDATAAPQPWPALDATAAPDPQGALAAARRAVAGLVSRDVTAADAQQVRDAALESLAENASDAIVAPLWWYALGGLPAAAAYRFANTADAMWGYRTAVWEWRGKAAARADDVANWWPARLTGLLLAPGAGVARIARTATVTASPNAGWPMGALALLLDVRLRKPGVYTLHPAGRGAGAG
ncbi:MAG TPA: CobD/CbiB family cobalamin biosynthesis protein, partial [Euzebyales bacterium]|nr:CobD/CbiB family cobalamin biosynthesis protein [Euzebyales bacterium]